MPASLRSGENVRPAIDDMDGGESESVTSTPVCDPGGKLGRSPMTSVKL
jgi:hypothetical protein